MAVNGWLASAGVILVGLGLFHSLMGERFIVRRLLRRDNLPRLFGGDSFTKLTIRYAWHLLTLVVFGLAGVLWVLAGRDLDGEDAVLLWIAFYTLIAGAAWGMLATRGRHLSWVVLLAAAACVWIGAGFGLGPGE